MILEPLGGFEHVKSGFIRKSYDFTTKASLPYIKPKRARNIPDIHYDENNMATRVVEQIATDIYSSQVKENFETIGFIPKVKALSVNINFTSKQKNEPIKEGFSPKSISAKQATPSKIFNFKDKNGNPYTPSKSVPTKKSPTRSDYKSLDSDSGQDKSSEASLNFFIEEQQAEAVKAGLMRKRSEVIKPSNIPIRKRTVSADIPPVVVPAGPRRSVRIESKKK